VAVAFTVFGFLDLIAIGAPFFLTGVAMLAAGRWRRDPGVLWPALVGAWSFVIGYVLVAPLGCTSTASSVLPGAPSVQHTTCANLLGIDYSGSGIYNPSLVPAVFVGFAAAGIGSVVTRRLLRRRREPHVA
jgi:hypothetical protein